MDGVGLVDDAGGRVLGHDAAEDDRRVAEVAGDVFAGLGVGRGDLQADVRAPFDSLRSLRAVLGQESHVFGFGVRDVVAVDCACVERGTARGLSGSPTRAEVMRGFGRLRR